MLPKLSPVFEGHHPIREVPSSPEIFEEIRAQDRHYLWRVTARDRSSSVNGLSLQLLFVEREDVLNQVLPHIEMTSCREIKGVVLTLTNDHLGVLRLDELSR